jgi:tetratricopeptide (TPR) repeat protein
MTSPLESETKRSKFAFRIIGEPSMTGKSLGHYELLDTIGCGGMGQVYRARDRKLGRDVAVKLLPATLRGDEKALARFEREAKALASLNHPNIVTIYSIEKENDDLFLTMELVRGNSLESYIRDEGMTVDEFQKIAVPLTDAVAAAHANGVIHRDLKPSNIFVSDAGRVKVLDFGVALVLHAATLTDANTTVGTVAYMSPEQISGGEVDGRSDVFSMGIVFYELLSGARPFRGEHPAAFMYSIVNEDAARLTSLPNAVADVIDRCLEKNPEQRFASADDLGDALRDSIAAPAPITETEPATISPEIQAAFDRADWEEAYRALHAFAERRELSAEELEILGACAIWLSEYDECIQTWEKAFTAYSKAGRNIPAARVALELVGIYIEKLSPTVSGGWLKRAERLLQNEPECVERGLMLRRQTVNALREFDFAHATELNQKCAELADRFSDLDLQTVALHDRGQILITRGDVEEGLALIDEAMTSAVSGEVTTTTLGVLYCRTLSMCRSLADYNRAREWSEAAWRWSQSHTASAFPGICRVHSAETMRHQGLWTEAEQSVRKACDDFARHRINSHAGEAFIELGELALRKGDYNDAENAFRQALELGVDPVPGLPLLRQAQGKGEAALQSIERALGEVSKDRLRRAKLLAASIDISLANGRLSLAEAAVDELADISRDFGCPCFRAHALMGQGAVELERGNHGAATPALREAWSIFNKTNFPYDAARSRTLMAQAYMSSGNKEDAKLHLEAASKTFRELGAKTDLKAASELIKKLK